MSVLRYAWSPSRTSGTRKQSGKVHMQVVGQVTTEIEGAAEAQGKQTAATNETTAALQKTADAVQKLGEKLNENSYAQLDPDGKVRALQFDIDGVKERLLVLGLAAQTPQAAFQKLSEFPADMQAKMVPLIDQWNTLGIKMTDAFTKAQSSAQQLWEKINQADFSKLDASAQLTALENGLDRVSQRLHAFGIDAQSPTEAFKLMLTFPPDMQAKIGPLIADWVKMQGEITKAGDAEKKAAQQAAKDEAAYQTSLDKTLAQLKQKADALGLSVKFPDAPKTATSDDEKALQDAIAKRDAQTDPQNWTNYDTFVQEIQKRLTGAVQGQVDNVVAQKSNPTPSPNANDTAGAGTGATGGAPGAKTGGNAGAGS